MNSANHYITENVILFNSTKQAVLHLQSVIEKVHSDRLSEWELG